MRFLFRSCAVISCLMAVSDNASSQSSQDMRALKRCELRPVFMENFSTMSIGARQLNRSRWTAHTPWNGDFGDAGFSDPGPLGPFSLSKNGLEITARRDAEGKWHSGLIAAADASGDGVGVQYGYFEARMKFPPGPGTWPAFWVSTLKPQNEISPTVEIDAVEYYGHDTSGYQSGVIVWDPNKKNNPSKNWNKVPDKLLISDFHNFGVRIDSDFITFYLDRSPVFQTETPKEHTRKLFPLVNLALGSGYSIDKTPNPSTLYVKYVHVFELDKNASCAEVTSADMQWLD